MSDFEWHCNEIVAQADLFADHLDGADLTVSVPTCPDWNVSQLAATSTAACAGHARSSAPAPSRRLRTPRCATCPRATDDDPTRLATALRVSRSSTWQARCGEAGPDAQMWCPVPGGGSAFFARRFAHETAIHRADAALALGIDYVVPNFVAVDGVEEWLELGCMPFHFEVHPWMRDLLGPGRTIGLHATDTGDPWLLDFTGDAIAWRRGAEHPAAELRGPVTELLLALYRRLR